MALPGKTLDLFSALQPEAPGLNVLATVPEANPPAAADDAEQLWAALHLPFLALEALGFSHAGNRDRSRQARVVVETIDRQQQVVACNRIAAGKGIAPGMGINAAHALVDALQVHGRQPARERACLERVAIHAGRFTPRVSLAPPDGLLLEVKGSLRLFGGVDSLCARLAAAVTGQATVVLSLAPQPRAALWLARGASPERVTGIVSLRGAVADLPLTVTRWPEPVLQLLAAMGIHSVGECLRLPRDGLARRVGPRPLLELDQAVGRAAEVRCDHRQQHRFADFLQPDEEIEGVERLGQELEPLLKKLGAFLTARQCSIQALELSLYHRHHEPTRKILRFAVPISQPEEIAGIVRLHFEQLFLPAPVRSIGLRSGTLLVAETATKRMQFAQGAERFRQPEQATILRLVEKLRARLGESACYRLRVVADHRPEKASAQLTDLFRVTGPAAVVPDRVRPCWLLDLPEPLDEQQGWPCYRGALVLERGPERIESGWWDGEDVARDYYVARSGSGIRLWIYRNRRPPHGWFLHGLFG